MSIELKAWPLALIAATTLTSGASAQEPALPPGLSGAGSQDDRPQSSEPSLPPGLGGSSEPGLPPGLSSDPESDEPALPMGLGGETDTADDAPKGSSGLLSLAAKHGIKGFLDVRLGSRTQRDPYSRTVSIAEARLRLEAERQVGDVFLTHSSIAGRPTSKRARGSSISARPTVPSRQPPGSTSRLVARS